MDKDRIKTDLLAIIKEAENLDLDALELVPGTDIRIKKGRLREFLRLCDNFYELEFNQIVNDNTDTVTPVYEFLGREVLEENADYLTEEAYQYVKEVTPEYERFQALHKSLAAVDKAYKMTVRDVNELYRKRTSSANWQKMVDEKNAEVKRLGENANILRDQMQLAAKNVSISLLRVLDKQMEGLRKNFVNTTRGTNSILSVDKETIVLESDKKEYDSLYLLSQILKIVVNSKTPIEDLEVLDSDMDNYIIVPKDRTSEVKALLNNIALFQFIQKPKELTGKEINANLIERIKKELASETKSKGKREMSSNEDSEKNNLVTILDMLEKANASSEELFSVWDGTAYVLGTDIPLFESLVRKTPSLNDLNPDTKKREENEELINELYDYLNSLADKVRQYTGVANLPIKLTRTLNDRAWVVIDGEDLQEANRIIDLIELLSNQKDNLVSVWGVANVSYNDIAKFKRLANSTKYLGGMVPNIPQNEEEMKKVHEALAGLIRKAKETKGGKLASNGLVLESDLEIYKLLEKKYQYLEEAKAIEDLAPINGVMIAANHAGAYEEVNEKLNKLLNPLPEKSPLDEEIEVYEAGLKALDKLSSHNLKQREEYDILTELIEILKRAKTSTNLVTVGELKIDADDEARYKELKAKLDEILKPEKPDLDSDKETEKAKTGTAEKDDKSKNVGATDDKKKKVVGIRKLAKKGLDFAKKNWKQILVLGLGIAATLYVLPTLIPTLIFANSCTAAAAANIPVAGPLVAGFFNGCSSVLATGFGIPFTPGAGLMNIGVSAELALPSMLNALARVGVIGFTGYTAKKMFIPKKLSDSNKKGIIERLKGLARDLRNDQLDLSKELEYEYAQGQINDTALVNAQMEYDISSSERDLTNEEAAELEALGEVKDVPVLDNLGASYPEDYLENQIRIDEIVNEISQHSNEEIDTLDVEPEPIPEPVTAKRRIKERIEELESQLGIDTPLEVPEPPAVEDASDDLDFSGDVVPEALEVAVPVDEVIPSEDAEPEDLASEEEQAMPQVVVPSSDEIMASLDTAAQEMAPAVPDDRLAILNKRLEDFYSYRDQAEDPLAKAAYQIQIDDVEAEIKRLNGENLGR